MPIILFMEDHKAETISRVVEAVKAYRDEYQTDDMKFSLASGPVGVMAATNEAVSAAQDPMMLYVFGAVIALCLISFRSLRATLVVVIPLYVVSVLAQALMTYLQIGLTVSTLPVIALGVGIGVDYGIYILYQELNAEERRYRSRSIFRCLKRTWKCCAIYRYYAGNRREHMGVLLLKFQMDMGILLTFMFVVNMLGAIIVLPALARFLYGGTRMTLMHKIFLHS